VSRLTNALISANQPAEAEEHLLLAQEKHPDNPLIIFSMGRVMEATGRLAEAEKLFRRSLELDPQSAPAHVRLASVALNRGDAATVNSELDAALKIDPRAPEANLVRGQLLERQGRLDEAAVAYQTELANKSGNLAASIALSRLEGHRGRPAEQERVLREAIRTNPESPAPYLILALTFLQREERYPEAVELAHLSLERGPQGQELQLNYFLLADLYNRLGNTERELEFAELGRRVAAGGTK
jgi:tetratricopeptide (TPR) repeat protein